MCEIEAGGDRGGRVGPWTMGADNFFQGGTGHAPLVRPPHLERPKAITSGQHVPMRLRTRTTRWSWPHSAARGPGRYYEYAIEGGDDVFGHDGGGGGGLLPKEKGPASNVSARASKKGRQVLTNWRGGTRIYLYATGAGCC